jgi:hypothetical protein
VYVDADCPEPELDVDVLVSVGRAVDPDAGVERAVG